MKAPLPHKVLFLTLSVFSATGGIEKVCRVLGKAIYELGLQYGIEVRVFALKGKQESADGNRYFPQTVFTAFGNNRVGYTLKSMAFGRKVNMVLMSHINLLIVGILVKIINPRVKLVLLAHGIEVWRPLPGWKKRLLKKVDLFLPVSHFTKNKMQSLYSIPEEKIQVLNNCLDSFLEQPLQPGKTQALLERYGLKDEHRVLVTVSRMVDAEQYKGYDRVLEALPALLGQYPNLRYLLIGKYDAKEKQRLDALVKKLGVQAVVVFTGFVAEEEMARHFQLGDIFVMPSQGEGFGMVFTEALFYGLPVIAGNADGSVDALLNGELGLLVDPTDTSAIQQSIQQVLVNPKKDTPNQQKLVRHFGYEGYKENWKTIMNTY